MLINVLCVLNVLFRRFVHLEINFIAKIVSCAINNWDHVKVWMYNFPIVKDLNVDIYWHSFLPSPRKVKKEDRRIAKRISKRYVQLKCLYPYLHSYVFIELREISLWNILPLWHVWLYFYALLLLYKIRLIVWLQQKMQRLKLSLQLCMWDFKYANAVPYAS